MLNGFQKLVPASGDWAKSKRRLRIKFGMTNSRRGGAYADEGENERTKIRSADFLKSSADFQKHGAFLKRTHRKFL